MRFYLLVDREPNRRPFANGKPRRKCEALDPRQLDNSSFVKNSPFKIFSGKGGAKFSKNEQFSSRPLSTFSHGNSGMKFPKGFRFGQKFE
jgi:hypothetical protein